MIITFSMRSHKTHYNCLVASYRVKTDSPDLQDQPDRKVTEETTAWMDFPVDQVLKVTVAYLEFLACPA